MQANKDNHQAYNPSLQPLAHNLRESATKAEACLWKYVLRAGMMKGYTFRHQRPVLRYVADFMCLPIKLIIELDGGIHQEDAGAVADLKRQQHLDEAGFTVLRFSNETVLQHIEAVRQSIGLWINVYEQEHSTSGRSNRNG